MARLAQESCVEAFSERVAARETSTFNLPIARRERLDTQVE